jgi:rubrerythrin
MVDTSDSRLIGASVWEQELFDALLAHEHGEEEVLTAYEALAKETSSETVRYLISLIVEDERRHHRILVELANTVRAEATLEKRGTQVPYLDVRRGDTALLEATRRFLAVERKDRAELKHLSRKLRAGSDGSLSVFVVDLLRSDTDRHIKVLRFIENVVRRSPLRVPHDRKSSA